MPLPAVEGRAIADEPLASSLISKILEELQELGESINCDVDLETVATLSSSAVCNEEPVEWLDSGCWYGDIAQTYEVADETQRT